jgi:hypothetical protein
MLSVSKYRTPQRQIRFPVHKKNVPNAVEVLGYSGIMAASVSLLIVNPIITMDNGGSWPSLEVGPEPK